MNASERYPTPLNEWFYDNGELTDLGITLYSFGLPRLDEVWQMMNLDRSGENMPVFFRRLMNFSLYEDSLLNYLFPDMGAAVFRLIAESTIAAYCNLGLGGLVGKIEEVLPSHVADTPLVFYAED